MFKRRLAVLGTVAVLAVAGLGGSAMADETPAPDAATDAVAVTTAAVCKTPDGKEVKLAESVSARVFLAPGERVDLDGGAPALKGEPSRTVEIAPLTEAAPTTPAATVPDGELATPDAPLVQGKALRTVPAQPATELPPNATKIEDLGKVVNVVCVAEKPAE
ncbi:hypothetical protein ACFFV7_12400 [Nonomuraea spiralis]|uniref:Secreted protein n=1 Tax=Nonomuraea spiralis TaxID=46182 RepID=A0ABV5IBT9_9ACTN|nr:hypothetical protein [Nonomuraea spiralis]GGS79672.1 hypothetical protein GCM10010176_023780 [Nonomuraea spiralis]